MLLFFIYCRKLSTICNEIISFFESKYKKKEFIYNCYSDGKETFVNIFTFSPGKTRYSLFRSQLILKECTLLADKDENVDPEKNEDSYFEFEGFFEMLFEYHDDTYSGVFQHELPIPTTKVFSPFENILIL